MKIWVDDVRPAPKGYVWCKSVIDFDFLKFVVKINEFYYKIFHLYMKENRKENSYDRNL